MDDEWDNPTFAAQWDRTALIGNPMRTEQLDILVSAIAEVYRQGAIILDLGMGSGLVEAQLFARLPDASVVGMESSPAMIALARQRLQPFEQQYTIIEQDIAHLQPSTLPQRSYQVILSVQTLHHLSHEAQRLLYQTVYSLLSADGVFFFMDRLTLDTDHFTPIYGALWQRLEQVSEVKSGWSAAEFLARQSGKEHPASLEQHLTWLREAGFAATCLHLHLNRALIAATKPT